MSPCTLRPLEESWPNNTISRLQKLSLLDIWTKSLPLPPPWEALRPHCTGNLEKGSWHATVLAIFCVHRHQLSFGEQKVGEVWFSFFKCFSEKESLKSTFEESWGTRWRRKRNEWREVVDVQKKKTETYLYLLIYLRLLRVHPFYLSNHDGETWVRSLHILSKYTWLPNSVLHIHVDRFFKITLS